MKLFTTIVLIVVFGCGGTDNQHDVSPPQPPPDILPPIEQIRCEPPQWNDTPSQEIIPIETMQHINGVCNTSINEECYKHFVVESNCLPCHYPQHPQPCTVNSTYTIICATCADKCI